MIWQFSENNIYLFSFIDECQKVGRCLDDILVYDSKANINECMKDCQERRGCEYSSFSTNDNLCSLHKSCDMFDTDEKFISSKWNCELLKGN